MSGFSENIHGLRPRSSCIAENLPDSASSISMGFCCCFLYNGMPLLMRHQHILNSFLQQVVRATHIKQLSLKSYLGKEQIVLPAFDQDQDQDQDY